MATKINSEETFNEISQEELESMAMEMNSTLTPETYTPEVEYSQEEDYEEEYEEEEYLVDYDEEYDVDYEEEEDYEEEDEEEFHPNQVETEIVTEVVEAPPVERKVVPKPKQHPAQQKAKKKQKVQKQSHPKIDVNKVPQTLGEYAELEEYKKSNEYKQEMSSLERLHSDLSDRSEIGRILETAKVNTDDLGSIVIRDESRTISKKENFSYLRSADPTYQVVLNQSAYTADMKSLKFKDIFALSNSVSNTYSGALDKYQTYFRAISDNSLGVLDFEKWTEITSLYDVSTLEFGIFNQTFPGETEFDIKCSKCAKTMKNVGISNDYLISTRNNGVYEQLDRVINSINDLERASEYSLVNKITRFQLPHSSAIIDIHIPTIADYLKLLEQVPESKLKAIETYVDVMLFIKSVYVVDVVATREEGKPSFLPMDSRNDILAFLKDMTLDDAAKLNKEISDKDTMYRIDYQIQSFPCLKCGEETGNINIDIESLLFEQAVAKLVTL